MARVFISHAGDGIEVAREVHTWLTVRGHEVFLDVDRSDGIPPGRRWRDLLYEHLRWADVVVCVVTSGYVASRWCAVEAEVARAWGSLLFPLRAEPGATAPWLDDFQWLPDYLRDPAAQTGLVEALCVIDMVGGRVWPPDLSPFPGLRPLGVERHGVLFGRLNETRELARRLRSFAERAEARAVLVVGPSGCGKSSLVQAGLVPLMTQEPGWWTLAPLSPGRHPVAALTNALVDAARMLNLGWTQTYVGRQLDSTGLSELADRLLDAAPRDSRRRLLIVVDQLEELLTQTTPTERRRFVELLKPALARPVHLVATLRPEFLDQLLRSSDLAALPTETYTLQPLRQGDLRAVIEGPARVAGIDVDEHLIQQLVSDTGGGEALPLLAYTLAQLADGVSRGGRLSEQRYAAIGGVPGALVGEADAALAVAVKLGGRSHPEVVEDLLRLVTVDEHGRPTRRRVRRDELSETAAAEMDVFVARRLLTTDDDGGTQVISVAHEAILSAWPPLADAIAARASALRTRGAIESAAAEWDGQGRSRNAMWSGGHLAAAVARVGAHMRKGVVGTTAVQLSDIAREFLSQSIRRDRSRRRRAVTVLSALLVLAVVGATVAVVQRQDAQAQRLVAVGRQLVAQADAIRDSDPRTALQLGLAAYRVNPDAETHAFLVGLVSTTRLAGVIAKPGLVAGQGGTTMSAVTFTSDGSTAATASSDGAALWDVTGTPRQLAPDWTGRDAGAGDAGNRVLVNHVAFAPNGRTLAVAGADTILWNVTDPEHPQLLGRLDLGHDVGDDSAAIAAFVAFAEDGNTVAVVRADATALLWDVTDPAAPRRLGELHTDVDPGPGQPSTVSALAFAPDGRTVAVASEDVADLRDVTPWDVTLWNITDRDHPHQLGHPRDVSGKVSSVAYASDGGTLAVAGVDGTTALWDVRDPEHTAPLEPALTGHSAAVNSVAFAPDGRMLATAGVDNVAFVWEISSPRRPRQLAVLAGHRGDVTSVAFASQDRVATASSDGTAMLWDLAPRLRKLAEVPCLYRTGVSAVHLDRETTTLDRAILTIAGRDQTTSRWDITDPGKPQQVEGPPIRSDGLHEWLASSPDGTVHVRARFDNAAVLEDTARHPVGPPLDGHNELVTSAEFAPDGWTLATGDSNGTVILRDVTDPQHPRQLGKPITDHEGPILSLAFAKDGDTLATASEDHSVILWDVTDRDRPRQLGQLHSPDPSDEPGKGQGSCADQSPAAGHNATSPSEEYPVPSSVEAMAFGPDTRILATGYTDGRIVLWDLGAVQDLRVAPATFACAVAASGLNRAQWARYVPSLAYRETCA